MENPPDKNTSLLNDRVETQVRVAEMVRLANPLLENSNLIKEGASIGPLEVQTLKDILQLIAPVTKDNYRIYAHSQVMTKFARKFAEKLGLNPDIFEIIALNHDIGRFITNRFYRSDLVGDSLLKAMGVRRDLCYTTEIRQVKKLGPSSEEKANNLFENMTNKQRLCQLADVCGKRKDDGGIPSFEEALEYHYASRGKYDKEKEGTLWPSERQISPDLIDIYGMLYEKEKEWATRQGINVERIRQEILLEERESPIRAIIFDVGGVLIPRQDNNKLQEELATAFQIDLETMKKLWEELIPKLQTGRLSENEFWLEIEKTGNEQPPNENYNQLLVGDLASHIDPKMEEILSRIPREYILAILSDTIPPHQRFLEQGNIYDKDKFHAVILSPMIKSNKKDLETYRIAAVRLYLPPQACLFIDDDPQFVQNAKKERMRAIQFTTPKNLEEDLSSLQIFT